MLCYVIRFPKTSYFDLFVFFCGDGVYFFDFSYIYDCIYVCIYFFEICYEDVLNRLRLLLVIFVALAHLVTLLALAYIFLNSS